MIESNQEEKKLTAVKLSGQLIDLEKKLDELSEQVKEREMEVNKLEEDREKIAAEREAAQQRLDEFNKEASERGNTQLPLLKSELVGKNTLKDSLNGRLREIEQRKLSLQRTIIEKESEKENARNEISNRNIKLSEISEKESNLNYDLNGQDRHP